MRGRLLALLPFLASAEPGETSERNVSEPERVSALWALCHLGDAAVHGDFNCSEALARGTEGAFLPLPGLAAGGLPPGLRPAAVPRPGGGLLLLQRPHRPHAGGL